MTRSCWTCCFSSVTFAPQAADLRCCGRCKCPVRQSFHPRNRTRSSVEARCSSLFFLIPVAALAQGSPFDTGFTAIQSLFTGTIAKVASYGDRDRRLWLCPRESAHKALAGVAAGTGIAVLAVNVLSWLWGV